MASGFFVEFGQLRMPKRYVEVKDYVAIRGYFAISETSALQLNANAKFGLLWLYHTENRECLRRNQ